MATTPEAQLAELQRAVSTLTQQLQEVTRKADVTTNELQILRDAQAQATADSWSNSPGGGRAPPRQNVRLLDPKHSTPEIFDGDRRKIRGWSKRVMAYANSIAPGFRGTMKWAVSQNAPITEEDVSLLEWPVASEASASLYDLRIRITDGEPQTMVEAEDATENGFECWRKIIQWYDSVTANNEMDIVNSLISVTRCKKPEAVMAAIQNWENEWAIYVDRTKESLPERWKSNLLLKIIPTEHEQ